MVNQDEELTQRCVEVCQRLMARHDWRLIERAEFIRRTYGAMVEQPGDNLQYVAYGVYNLAMYEACSGAQGPEWRERGFNELYRLLYERAWRSYNDVCEDATQQALTEVITRFEACREPRAFIFFALQHLMGAARSLRRRSGHCDSLEREVGDEGLSLGDTVADPFSLEDEAVSREQRLALHRFLASYVHENPRARKQIDAVRLKYLAGLDDEHISRELGVSVPSVHVLRSRGLSRLRNAPGWSSSWESVL